MQAAEERRGIAAFVCAAVFVQEADARTAVDRLDEYDDLGVGGRFLNFLPLPSIRPKKPGFFVETASLSLGAC